MVATAIHVQVTSGEWDGALALVDELTVDIGQTTVAELVVAYMSAIKAARGEPFDHRPLPPSPLGMRTDLVANATSMFLDAARARAAGELLTASERSTAAAFAFVESSGIDDDFPLFWVTAVQDAVAAGRLGEADKLVDLVAKAPVGHTSPHVRAQLRRLRAMVAIAAGREADVEADYLAAISALDEFGAPFFAACSRVELARWLIGHDRAEETEPLLAEAKEIFGPLRAAPWLAQVEQLSAVSVH